jgi:hypothetical protein
VLRAEEANFEMVIGGREPRPSAGNFLGAISPVYLGIVYDNPGLSPGIFGGNRKEIDGFLNVSEASAETFGNLLKLSE